ncbi:MAG: DUF624 domain-containing protein [Phototrophicaceae bacterium]
MRIVRVYWQSIKHLNYRGYIYVWANLLWVVLTILVFTAPAAWVGLMVLTHRANTRTRVTLDDFWDGFKIHFWRATLNGVISLLVFGINISNLLAYTPVDWLGNVIAMIWFLTLLIWIGMQLYLWTIIEEMATPSLWLGYRNAFLMVVRNPFITLALIIVTLITLIVSIFLPPLILLLTGSIITVFAVIATLNCLQHAGYQNTEHHIPIENRI